MGVPGVVGVVGAVGAVGAGVIAALAGVMEFEQPAMTPTDRRTKAERLRRKSCFCSLDRRRLVKSMSDPNGSNRAAEIAAAWDADMPKGEVTIAPLFDV